MIPQPKNRTLRGNNASVSLVWGTSFSRDKTVCFTDAQRFVDSECIRLMGKYTPERTKTLIRSVTLGKGIGTGKLVYPVPYGRYQYYGIVFGPNIPIFEQGQIIGWYSPSQKLPTERKLRYTKPTARPRWFEVMKANHGAMILHGAARIAGGR